MSAGLGFLAMVLMWFALAADSSPVSAGLGAVAMVAVLGAYLMAPGKRGAK
jgi:hypothetical protein